MIAARGRRVPIRENSGRHFARIIVCPERAILLPGDHVTNGSRKRGGIFHAVYSSVFLPPHTIILQPDDN